MEVSASSVLEKDVETVQTMINVLSITQLFCAEIGRELENNPSKVNLCHTTCACNRHLIAAYFS